MTGLVADPAEQAMASLWTDPFLGGLAQSGAQRATPARSNVQYLGLSGHANGALAATGVCLAVPIPVVPGDVITTVQLPVATTAASTPTHSFAALYSGIAVPALLGQSADGLTAAVVANKVFAFTLSAPVTITPAMAPNGFIYASVSFTATAVPTALGATIPTGGNAYVWFPGMPLFYAMTHGSAVAGTAPSTIASPSVIATAPYIVLT